MRSRNKKPFGFGKFARSTDAEAFAAGLVALRSAGLEPSDFAKELAAKVIAGEISADEMEAVLLEHHGLRVERT